MGGGGIEWPCDNPVKGSHSAHLAKTHMLLIRRKERKALRYLAEGNVRNAKVLAEKLTSAHG